MLKGKKVLILAERDYEDMELWYPKIRLTEEGANVMVAGTGEKTYAGKYGYPINVDYNIEECEAEDFDAVVVPGGGAPDKLRRHNEVNSFVRKMYENKKVVAAICHAGSVLISAGVVNGKNVTSFYSIKDDMVNAGGIYSDREVVVDGTLITSRTPADLPAFCLEIIRLLEK